MEGALICIKSDPPMPAMSESLLDPRVKFAVWQYDCTKIGCAACPPYKKRIFGAEDWFEDEDDDDGEDEDDECELTELPFPHWCILCNKETCQGFEYRLENESSEDIPQLVWCCGSPDCIAYARKCRIRYEENDDPQDAECCTYCGSDNPPMTEFYLDGQTWFHCNRSRCVNDANAELARANLY